MKQVVYVASPDSQQIHVWQLGSTGELTLLQTVEVPGGAADDNQPEPASFVCWRSP